MKYKPSSIYTDHFFPFVFTIIQLGINDSSPKEQTSVMVLCVQGVCSESMAPLGHESQTHQHTTHTHTDTDTHTHTHTHTGCTFLGMSSIGVTVEGSTIGLGLLSVSMRLCH